MLRLELDVGVAAADVAGTVAIFAGSRVVDNTSMYDAYWSVAPPFLLVLWGVLPGGEGLLAGDLDPDAAEELMLEPDVGRGLAIALAPATARVAPLWDSLVDVETFA